MKEKSNINPKDFNVGVIVGRFQVDELHLGQSGFIDAVFKNHKQVIIFFGVAAGDPDENDPLSFAMRKPMIEEKYPTAIVLPLLDIRYDDKWSALLDSSIRLPFGETSALLYGSRDSFLPSYVGKYPTMELITEVDFSGTQIRKDIAREVRPTKDFRAGVIQNVMSRRAVTYPTVDVVAYKEDGTILLAKKPNENLYRFIGGFVDRTDASYEVAAKREFGEETSGSEIDDLKYIASGQINDWRYAKSKSGIMTTLFLGKYIFGPSKPSDDIATLEWKNPFELDVDTDIMEEHRELFKILLTHLNKIKK